MTVLPQRPHAPLTIADWSALGETEERYELQEGNLVMMSPSPSVWHGTALGRLFARLDEQAPHGLVVVPGTDLNLQLDEAAATVRRPDLYVITRAEADVADRTSAVVRAKGTRLVVEIISPGSRRTDRVIKAGEYAAAGIGSYWIVERADQGASLTELRLGSSGYDVVTVASGAFETDVPFPVRLDLTDLG